MPGHHSYRDSFNTSEFIFNLEYLFRQGLKKPDIPRQRIVRLTPLHHTQEHSASLPPGVTSPGHFSVDLKSL
ncbi:hypothetical protein KOSB73_220546 [Klebsiella grimontii]|uniref:Uncharacterized protein n=1 Tax=Klebsiella grimontii TaxID=2058152 RepID=A0A285B0I6_9ENTR|nr:hypothetical protein KOSB73_220546 [Klebsiella grimontii]